jgi:hypothetical protein
VKLKCNNALHPDLHGHYREAKYTQTKHHWWWKANRIFNQLQSLIGHNGKQSEDLKIFEFPSLSHPATDTLLSVSIIRNPSSNNEKLFVTSTQAIFMVIDTFSKVVRARAIRLQLSQQEPSLR